MIDIEINGITAIKNQLDQALFVMKDSFKKDKIPVLNVLNFENYFVECVAKKP